MGIRGLSILFTRCTVCSASLRIVLPQFFAADGMYRCPHCTTVLHADGRQCRLLQYACLCRNLSDLAGDLPDEVELLRANAVSVSTFGLLHVLGSPALRQ